jgi:hypothetical protein
MPLGVQHFHAHIMPLAAQHLCAQLKSLMGHRYFHTHFNVLQTKHKQLNLYNKKRKHSQVLIVLQKATNNQIRS